MMTPPIVVVSHRGQGCSPGANLLLVIGDCHAALHVWDLARIAYKILVCSIRYGLSLALSDRL